MAHEQAPAVTWTSDAGTGPGNVPATVPPRLSLVTEVFSWLLIG